VSIETAKWSFHDDSTIDAAVVPIDLDEDKFDHKFIPTKIFTNERIIREQQIGPGDELFFPGLFVHHRGEQSNIPIIRSGNIAAMPGELIDTKWGKLRGYLAEARSVGGLSGSPVYVYLGAFRTYDKPHDSSFTSRGFYMLGLVHGHFDVENVLDAVADSPDSVPSKSINMGIAIIVPSDDILSVLDRPEFIASRDSRRIAIFEEQKKHLPVMD